MTFTTYTVSVTNENKEEYLCLISALNEDQAKTCIQDSTSMQFADIRIATPDDFQFARINELAISKVH